MSTTSTNTGSRNSGIGLPGLLALLFIALKLTGVIAWSWWWVLSPLWIGVGLALVFFLIAGVIVLTRR